MGTGRTRKQCNPELRDEGKGTPGSEEVHGTLVSCTPRVVHLVTRNPLALVD